MLKGTALAFACARRRRLSMAATDCGHRELFHTVRVNARLMPVEKPVDFCGKLCAQRVTPDRNHHKAKRLPRASRRRDP